MKNVFFLLLLISVSAGFQGCNLAGDDDNDPFQVSDLEGTYLGAMNVQNPNFSNAQYTVTVTQLSATSVRITPSTSVGTEWTATLTKIAGVYTCLGCITSSQITFTSLSNGIELSYNYENNEQFAGLKQ